MKKLLMSLCGFTFVISAGAYTTENLAKISYTCNGVRISYDSTESMIQNNCSNYKVKYSTQVTGGDTTTNSFNEQPSIPADNTGNDVSHLARVKFTTDNGTKMECFYREAKLYKCKAKVVKQPKKVASS